MARPAPDCSLEPAARTLRLWLWLCAAVVGALAAGATVGLRWLTQVVEWLATGGSGGLVEVARSLAPWHRAMVVAGGGLVAGLLLDAGHAWARRGPGGDRHLDYIDAARQGRVDLNDRTTFTRTASAVVSVGTGASIGREGPMVQMAAWLAARLAQLLPFTPPERSILLICGAAAGIGSTYHAPVAGVVFVLELALGFFARRTVAPVLIAVSTASGLIHWLLDPAPLYVMPVAHLHSASLGVALLAGVFFGLAGWGLLALLKHCRLLFARVPTYALRLGLGGLLVGLLSAAMPEVWGNGYSVVSRVLQEGIAWQTLAMILLLKVLATALSSGSGAVGGAFTPSLFVGAAAGCVLAQLAMLWLPAALVGDPRAMAVIGMAAMLAAMTHAPVMAIVMVLEMTNQFHLAIPVMLASGMAYAVSTGFGAHPLYGNPIEVDESGKT
ncbi:chloride channel protein [Variovorax rhizosphaerae]|uniref:Chloride channel protein n=1 Tax=Variovorax rhizosphaerae TaxID=1836200 RepID=A0ABU8WMN6_9BURK